MALHIYPHLTFDKDVNIKIRDGTTSMHFVTFIGNIIGCQADTRIFCWLCTPWTSVWIGLLEGLADSCIRERRSAAHIVESFTLILYSGNYDTRLIKYSNWYRSVCQFTRFSYWICRYIVLLIIWVAAVHKEQGWVKFNTTFANSQVTSRRQRTITELWFSLRCQPSVMKHHLTAINTRRLCAYASADVTSYT